MRDFKKPTLGQSLDGHRTGARNENLPFIIHLDHTGIFTAVDIVGGNTHLVAGHQLIIVGNGRLVAGIEFLAERLKKAEPNRCSSFSFASRRLALAFSRLSRTRAPAALSDRSGAWPPS